MPTDEFFVLHGLRLKGLASAEAIEDAWGVESAAGHLAELAGSGCCQYRETPRASGYLLLPPGRDLHGRLLEGVRDEAGASALAALSDVYSRFEPLNSEFKDLCSRWQIKVGAPNDHTDPGYDDSRITELDELHGRFLPLVVRAGRALPHFQRYPPRFREALRRLRDDGDLEWFTKPLVDSYHTVWYEFHEDLIATLGRERRPDEA